MARGFLVLKSWLETGPEDVLMDRDLLSGAFLLSRGFSGQAVSSDSSRP